MLKVIMLIIFGLPFFVFEFVGFAFSLLSLFFPILGIVLNFTICLVCDLLSGLFFYLITLPNTVGRKNGKEEIERKMPIIYLPNWLKDKLPPLLNFISNHYFGKVAETIRQFNVMCMLSDTLPRESVIGFYKFLIGLRETMLNDSVKDELDEAINTLQMIIQFNVASVLSK